MSTNKQVALNITPLSDGKGDYRIGIGFQTDTFNQAVMIPYTTIENAIELAAQIQKAIIESARECQRQKLGLITPK